MAKREILAGATDQTIDIFIQDSSSTTGAGLSGLVYNTASLVCYYRKGATGSATQLTLATQTVGGAHSDGGFVEIQATNMKGVYRLDLSDTIVASAGMVTIYLYGAANMVPVVAEIEVVAVNKFDSVRMGMTALPNAAAEAAGGLYTRGTGAGQINQDANGRINTNIAAINTSSMAAIRLALSAGVIIPGTIDSAGFSPTNIEFEADDITEATSNHYNDRVIIFTSGALIGQATSISSYSLSGGRGHFNVVAMTEVPANDDTFIII